MRKSKRKKKKKKQRKKIKRQYSIYKKVKAQTKYGQNDKLVYKIF